jgi:hypothetical protein
MAAEAIRRSDLDGCEHSLKAAEDWLLAKQDIDGMWQDETLPFPFMTVLVLEYFKWVAELEKAKASPEMALTEHEEAKQEAEQEAERIDPQVPHFEYKGDFWEVTFNNLTRQYEDTLGMWYIDYLIRYTGGIIRALPLYARVKNLKNGLPENAQPQTLGDHYPTPEEYSPYAEAGVDPEDSDSKSLGQTIGSSLGDAGKDTDKKTLSKVRKQIREINEKIKDNDVWTSQENIKELQKEKNDLLKYIESTTGKRLRIRKSSGDPSEKARNSVSKAIRRVLGKFEKSQPALWQHLAPPSGKLHLGYELWYEQPGYRIDLRDKSGRIPKHKPSD